MHNIIVVTNPKDWDFHVENVEVVSAQAYLTDTKYAEMRNIRVYNLCKSYRYQTNGYYVSLLAEARGHRICPNITTIQDFTSQAIVRVISEDIDELIQRKLAKLRSDNFVLSIYFGKNISPQYEELSRQLYNLFQTPLLRARFIFNKKWILQHITPVPLNEIPESHKPYIVQFAREYFSRKKFRPAKLKKYFYDLAILVNPQEKDPPSNKRAIQNFIEAARELGFYTELITKDDYSRLAEFDALFIRETTFVNHYTYRFSRRAYAEGLVVIDDPLSILRCTNKVYLAELLARARVPTPKTLVVHKDKIGMIEKELGVPCVLKQPDSAFSRGVVKVDDMESLENELKNLLQNSDLIIAQEFMPTEFDWRIGILDRRPLYACKYFMAHEHWQIYNWKAKRHSHSCGEAVTISLNEVPENVIAMALKTTNFIGDGFYGVDLKQSGDKVCVIEVNDNPSIDAGVEDAVIKDELYLAVMRYFVRRLAEREE
ncbi:MAG: RimK family protein [Candidatus Omnitrophica bacterium]|nr:RimK family protein [Candidatus Omnitrophota bacterium]MBU4479231.1 RimK family protein [Candidatus Omnitrophota bacterium]MCG2703921.1 RimK family protein [Candidatus Omnitrophota bacterium]